jgi:hypothetical protein
MTRRQTDHSRAREGRSFQKDHSQTIEKGEEEVRVMNDGHFNEEQHEKSFEAMMGQVS